MNYALQVVRGRSGATTLKLIDGVNSIGRHDDCVIRIRSSQVSRRHCELYEEESKLVLRDLGSSNGTFVNGKRVLGKQTLKVGDVLTIGGVTLRVDSPNAAAKLSETPSAPQAKPGDTAVVNALPVAEDGFEMELGPDEELEIALEDDADHHDIVPLDDEAPTKDASKPGQPAAAVQARAERAKGVSGTADITEPASKSPLADEEDAVAQFLMDLKLDEDD
jgi:pSer/pThr/pTyr-binding forkhead associated (FHA) protein